MSTVQPQENEKRPVSPRDLTGEEEAIYDRQIRLWGIKAQKMLASCKVLLSGDVTSLLAQEIAKNVVLAGIAQLVISMPPDNRFNKFPSLSFLGSDLSQISASLTDMNPHVDVVVSESTAEKLCQSVTIVCGIGLNKAEELSLSDQCRLVNVPIMLGRIIGSAGWVFLDFGDKYQYQEKVKNIDNSNDNSTTVIKSDSFCTYRQAIDALWGQETIRSEFGWHIASTFQHFELLYHRFPNATAEDSSLLGQLYSKLCSEKKPRKTSIDLINRVAQSAQFTLGPVAAIVGGAWGREIIKFAARNGQPLNNFFFFNASSSAGSVQRVGPPVQ